MGKVQLTPAHFVDGFGNLGKKTEDVKIMNGVGALHILEKWFLLKQEKQPKSYVPELAGKKSNIDWTAVERRLEVLGVIRKLGLWVPHQLAEDKRVHRIATCIYLLSRYKYKPFLWIVIEDEKMVMYSNVKSQRTMCRPSEPPV